MNEPDQQPKGPQPKTCGNCDHFQPDVNPDTGRVRPSLPGLCTWECPSIPIPQSFWLHERSAHASAPRVTQVLILTPRGRSYIYCDTPAERCPCWKEREADRARRLHGQQAAAAFGGELEL